VRQPEVWFSALFGRDGQFAAIPFEDGDDRNAPFATIAYLALDD
jgi:hypothetical protein